jgi:hypothetical protein
MKKIKYSRTWHLPYSEKCTADDKKHKDERHHEGNDVVITVKLDGENSNLYTDTYHARSLDSQIDSEDRRWLEAFRMTRVAGRIADTERIIGENLFYRHTCRYEKLNSLFYAFSMWDGDVCLPWDDTTAKLAELGIEHAPVIYRGVYNKEKILKSFSEYVQSSDDDVEGFVVRNTFAFNYIAFKTNVSKFVRKDFQVGDKHWRHSKKTINGLVSGKNPWEIL